MTSCIDLKERQNPLGTKRKKHMSETRLRPRIKHPAEAAIDTLVAFLVIVKRES